MHVQNSIVSFLIFLSCQGLEKDFEDANVVGTHNVVEGCIRAKVQRLVYVSTPSLYFTAKPGDRFNVSEKERLPFPEDLPSFYAKSKLRAEVRIVFLSCFAFVLTHHCTRDIVSMFAIVQL